MTTATFDLPSFSDEEIETLRRFKKVITDRGVWAGMMEFVLRMADYSAAARGNYDEMRQDVLDMSPEEMYRSGPSLAMLVEVANNAGTFPDDFVPTDETVEKCIDAFWDSHRS